MTITPPKDRNLSRFWILDVLRGVAILGVISFHVLPLELSDNSPLSLVRYGGIVGVSFFFVLSGFSIHLSQLRKDQNQSFAGLQFLWKRLKRLYPPYLAAIGVAIAINITWAVLRGKPAFSFTPTPVDFLSHLLLIHTFHPQTFFGIIPALWFIAVLFHLYLLYPVFRGFSQQWGNTSALFIVLAITLIARFISDTFLSPVSSVELTTVLQNNAPQRWFEWCFGAWIATRLSHQIVPPQWFSSLTGLLLVVWVVIHPSQAWLSEPLLGICIGSLLWHLVSWEPQWSLHAPWQPWLYLGQLSYPIYLIHQIFVPYVRSAIDPSLFSPLPTFCLVLSGVLFLTLPLAIAFHHLLEKPAPWRRNLFHERS